MAVIVAANHRPPMPTTTCIASPPDLQLHHTARCSTRTTPSLCITLICHKFDNLYLLLAIFCHFLQPLDLGIQPPLE
jgi:hypothetical protein